MLDRIYYYFWAIVPQKKRPEDSYLTAATYMYIFISFNLVTTLGIIGRIVDREILFAFGRDAFVLFILFIGALIMFYYSRKEIVENILRRVSSNTNDDRFFFIGWAIIIWTFLFPLVGGAMLIAL